MFRIVLALSALVLVAPVASAGPVSDALSTVVGAVCPSPLGDLACSLPNAFRNVTGAADSAVVAVLEAAGQDEPLVAVVDELERAVCGSPQAWNSTQCRQVSGRLGFPGAFDVCASSPPPNNVLGATLHAAVSLVDDSIAAVTSGEAFAGTPVEGEHPCYNHWQTLRAVASLP